MGKPLAPVLQTALVRLLEGPAGEAGSAEAARTAAASRTLATLALAAPRVEALVKTLCKPAATVHQMEALEGVLRALLPSIPAEAAKEARAALTKAAADKDPAVQAAAARCSAVL